MPDDVKMTFGGDARKLIAEQQKIIAKQDQVIRQTKRSARESRSASGSAASDLKSMAAGWVSVGAAIAGATRLMNTYYQQKRRNVANAQAAEQPLRALLQLSGGDQAQYARMMSAAQASAQQTGTDLATAAGWQFAMESMGLAGSRRTLAGLHMLGLDPGAMAEGVSTLQNAMGRRETGSARLLLNKMLAGSKVSKTGADQFGAAASQAAKTVGLVGGTDEELLSSLAILSTSTESASVAATQIDAFAAALMKRGMTGGLFANVRRIRALGLSDQELQKFFGRKEGVKGFLGLSDQMDRIAPLAGQLGSMRAGPGDYLSGLEAVGAADPLLSAALERRRARAGHDVAGAASELTRDARVDRTRRYLAEQGPLGAAGASAYDLVTGNAIGRGIRDYQDWQGEQLSRVPVVGDLVNMWMHPIDKFADAVEEMADAARAQKRAAEASNPNAHVE